MDRGRRIHKRTAAYLGRAPDQGPQDVHYLGAETLVAEQVAFAKTRGDCRNDYWRRR